MNIEWLFVFQGCDVIMAAASVSQSVSVHATEKSQLTLKGKNHSYMLFIFI